MNGLSEVGLQAKSGLMSFLKIKIYWDTPMPIHVCIVICGSFTLQEESQSCDGDCMAQKVQNLLSGPLQKTFADFGINKQMGRMANRLYGRTPNNKCLKKIREIEKSPLERPSSNCCTKDTLADAKTNERKFSQKQDIL